MKKLLFTLLFSTIGFFAVAQSVLEDNIQKLNVAKSQDDFKTVKNNLASRISSDSDWHIAYYASLATLKEAELMLRAKKTSEIDALTDEALKYLNSIAALESTNSEIRALKAYLYMLKTSVNPTERSNTYGLKASEYLYLAKNIDAANPRFDLVRAQLEYLLNSKSDDKKLKRLFQYAATRLKAYTPQSKLDPNWGLKDAEYYISLLK